MRFKISIIFFALGILFFQTFYPTKGNAKNEQQIAHQKFKKIVKSFNEIFKTDPKLIRKSYGIFVDKITYTIEEYKYQNIKYDIQKTDSIVSPFQGFIFVNTIERDNSSCGNVKSKYSDKFVGYDSIENAIKNADNKDCFKHARESQNRFIFSYQEGNWRFKQVKSVVNKEVLNNDHFMAVFRIKDSKYHLILTEKRGVEFNRKWHDLINNNL